jgi:large subunit ribosomal protein L6
MSRTGKLAIKIPSGTEVAFSNGEVSVKGKGGTLTRAVHPSIGISIENGEVVVAPVTKTRLARALWGTYAAHVRVMVAGVNTPFVKKLDVQGIGYKAELAGKTIKLTVGFSHPVIVAIPEGLTVAIDKNIHDHGHRQERCRAIRRESSCHQEAGAVQRQRHSV